ncbi:MAG: hypothetical protein U9P71_02735 [Campylobacterota bacterium]|nr:hypothetical protein [Campylobacterota bacterium]
MNIFSSIINKFNSKDRRVVQSKQEKREEIIVNYEKRLHDALLPLKADQEVFIERKSELLRAFSVELSHNIFFDKDEIRGIIRELAHYEPQQLS